MTNTGSSPSFLSDVVRVLLPLLLVVVGFLVGGGFLAAFLAAAVSPWLGLAAVVLAALAAAGSGWALLRRL